MMRFGFTLLAISLTFATGCKKSGGSGEAIGKMTAFKDKMCACKDKACVDGVTSEMTKWGSEQKGGDVGKVSEDDQKKLAAVTEEMSKCITKVMTDAAAAGSAAGAGSDTGAAAGSDTGSAGGDGSGSAAAADKPAADGMAHRAGMCPSTVLGATTKAAVKGKTVVVTIQASDKDAIAAIQKRADESVAEKKDAPAVAGGAHDQKGTRGGGQGLCPVYVPDGATATAKHEAKGAIVTITPKDQPAELAKEIDGRIAKATDWVKANVKEGDNQNQGGVGGGKGDDGSNHSGEGDGKGHERKGSGGGKGTGGGGGAGTGAGSSKP